VPSALMDQTSCKLSKTMRPVSEVTAVRASREMEGDALARAVGRGPSAAEPAEQATSRRSAKAVEGRRVSMPSLLLDPGAGSNGAVWVVFETVVINQSVVQATACPFSLPWRLRSWAQLTAFLTSAAILFSSAAVGSVSAKEVGHIPPASMFAASSKPNVAYLDLNFSAGL
jgi:hypothetical protein